MTIVDLAFTLQSAAQTSDVIEVPRDHGYALYGAISRTLPALHEASWLAVHPLGGTPADGNRLRVHPLGGLRLRVPTDHIATALGLTGQTLDVAGTPVRVGAPTVHALVPAASLDARLVVVKLTDVPMRDHPTLARPSLDRAAMEIRVRDELDRQLERLGIAAKATLAGHGRMIVAGKQIVGFSVRILGLSADASLALQAAGLGGKRRMGCGVFRPTRGA